MKSPFQLASIGGAALLLSLPAAAQVKLGYLTTSMTGTVSPGYSATYGNQTGSTHSWAIGGEGSLTGSYYSPNFLNFNANFYLNQSRANSNFQSITNASGVDLSANLFGGTHYPGTITYSKAYNSEGNYAIPGLANYVTHGNSDTLGISWSENLPDKPSLAASYSMGSSQYSVYGTNDSGQNHFHSASLHSAYSVGGYTLGAYYSLGHSNAIIPQVIINQPETETRTSTNNFGFTASHRLPWQGTASSAFTRSNYDTEYLGSKSSGTIDVLSGIGVLHPRRNLSLTGTANYSDNLSGQFIQSIVGAGTTPQASAPSIFDSSEKSNSLDLMAVAAYSPTENSDVELSVERRVQNYLGNTYEVDTYAGSGRYTHRLFEGNLSSALSMSANRSGSNGQDTLGLTVSENYSTVIDRWHLSGNFNYAQNVQTLLVTYTNSFYNFSGNAHRNWGHFNFGASAAASHTAITAQPDTANSSQSYSSTVGYSHWITANGGYSKSSGQALITGSGLVPVPLPPVVPPSLLSMYGGEGYSFGASSAPYKALLLQASWSRSNSSTTSDALTSRNHNGQFDTLIQYRYRKLSFNAGYAQLSQGFSNSGLPTQVVSSYFMGASRWFKFF